MTTNYLLYLNQLATYLKVKPGKLSLDSNSVPVHTTQNKVVKGFFNIIKQLLVNSPLGAATIEESAEIYQWIEYGIIYCVNNKNTHFTQVLTELNNLFSTQTYLVSHRLTIADVVLYYILHNYIESMSYLDKEKFINISRWFDNLQQDSSLRQKNKMVNFETSYLATIIPSRH